MSSAPPSTLPVRETPTAAVHLRVPPTLVRWVGWSAVLLVLAHLGVVLIELVIGHDAIPGTGTYVRLFWLDDEANVPTWFSSVVWLLGAAGLGLIALRARVSGDRWRRHWSALALVALFISFDEAATIHEKVIVALKPLQLPDLGGWLRFWWVVPYAVLLVVLVVVMIPFLRALPPATRRGLLVAGGLFTAGALGVEVVSAKIATDLGFDSVEYMALVTVEETLELAGLVVFLRTVLAHLRALGGGVRVTVG